MTALKAPRALNAPDRCSDSSFSETRAPVRSDNQADSMIGVRRTNGAIRLRAAKMSMSVILASRSPSGLPRKDLGQLRRERRSRENLADSGVARGGDGRAVD